MENSKAQLEREVEAAVESGLRMYSENPQAFIVELGQNTGFNGDMTVEEAGELLAKIRENKDVLVKTLTEELFKQIDTSVDGSVTMSDAQGGQSRVAVTDGGSILSESGRDTFIVSMVAFNGIMTGINLASEKYSLAALSAFALTLFLIAHIGLHYDVEFRAKERG